MTDGSEARGSGRPRNGSVMVFGVGPGLGSAIVRAFDRAGFAVAAVAREPHRLAELHARATTEVLTLAGDATSDPDVRRAVATARSRWGHLDAVVYNAALIRPDDPLELDPAGHLRALDVNVLGALRLARAIIPGADPSRRTTFVVTGGMPQVKAPYTSLSVGKAALRALVDSLVQAHESDHVRIGMLTIDGVIAPGTPLDPDLVAREYLAFHTEPDAPWCGERVIAPQD